MKNLKLFAIATSFLNSLSISSLNAQIASEGLGTDHWGCNNALFSDGCVYTICPTGGSRSCGAQD